MVTMDGWTDRLSDYLDGELTVGERARLEAHLHGCATCAATLAQLREVVARARTLPATAPARDLWPGVAAAIGAGGDAPSPSASWRPRTASPPRLRALTLTLPQLAAASLVLALGSGLAGRFLLRADPDPVSGARVEAGVLGPAGDGDGVARVGLEAPPGYADELARLQRVLTDGRDRLDPNTVRILEKNLAVIDGAIRESLGALAVDPDNAFVEEHLERAYRRKVDYLRQATALLSWGT